MQNIREIPIEDLEKEIERRRTSKPQLLPMEDRDFSKIETTLKSIINEIDLRGSSKDQAHFVYEATMNAFYGENVFDWINENDEGEG